MNSPLVSSANHRSAPEGISGSNIPCCEHHYPWMRCSLVMAVQQVLLYLHKSFSECFTPASAGCASSASSLPSVRVSYRPATPMTSRVIPTVVAPYLVSAGTSDVKRSCAQQTHMSHLAPSISKCFRLGSCSYRPYIPLRYDGCWSHFRKGQFEPGPLVA